MTHWQLITSILGVHVAVLLSALGALSRYGRRSDLFEKSLGTIDETLRRIRETITDQFKEHLKPVFDEVAGVSHIIVRANAGGYADKPINPADSEAYHNALLIFVEGSADAIGDYRLLKTTMASWRFWTKLRSWLVLVLLVWQVLAACLVGILDALLSMSMPSWLLISSLLPTVMLVLGFLLQCMFVMRQEDRILQLKVRYDAP